LLPLLLLLVAASSPAARAAAGEPRELAAAHYRRGIELAKQGRYGEALEQFNQAYQKSPHFAVLYNIGQAQIALGRPLAAIEALTTYLRDGADKVPLSRREQVQAQIALLEASLAELTIVTDRPDVAIRVDDRDVGRTPLFQPIRLAAGTHTITASPPGGAQITRVVTLAESERQRLELALTSEEPDATAPAVTTEPEVRPVAPPPAAAQGLASPGVTRASSDTPSPRDRPMRRMAYVSAGLGVAAAGAALGVYIWNRGRYEDWQAGDAALQDLKFGSAAYQKKVTENNDLGSSLINANRAIVGLSIAGGLLVATGATLWLVDRERASNGELALSVTGSSAQLGWRARW
jgi:tetratricopeptide (TPR) repeat protein